MKKIILLILLYISLTSCSMSLYETQDYEYPKTHTIVTTNYGMYYHQYYYNGLYCPVIYIKNTPYYFYKNYWYIVPYSNYKHIIYNKRGTYLKHRPPYNYRKYENRQHKYYKHHYNNRKQNYDKKHNKRK